MIEICLLTVLFVFSREWVVFFSFDHTLTSLDGPPKLGHALERPSAGLTVTSGRRGHADRLFPPILHKQAVFVWSQLRCDSRVPRAISQEPLVYLEAAYAADDEFLHGFRHHICAGLECRSLAVATLIPRLVASSMQVEFKWLR